MKLKEMAKITLQVDCFAVNHTYYHLLFVESPELSHNQGKLFQLFYSMDKVENSDIGLLETLIGPLTKSP